ncbi:MAG: superoxide dismutase family protein [Sphingomonadales bacterium]
MRFIGPSTAVAVALIYSAPALGQNQDINPSVDPVERAKAVMQDRDGRTIGTVLLEETPHGTLLDISLHGVPAGAHAIHIHEVGECAAPFASAGGHLNPRGAKHGFRTVKGPHLGDLPNLHVPDSGVLHVEYFHPWLIFGDEFFDADGAAMIIHQGADDYRTDPAGAAGPRIACGVIKPQK